MFRTTWDEHGETHCARLDAPAVAGLLDRLAGTGELVRVEIACIEIPGRALGIVVGGEHTVLTYQDSVAPPYLLSLGEDRARPDLAYRWAGGEEEQLGRNVVPWPVGRDSALYFLARTRRPDTLFWERL